MEDDTVAVTNEDELRQRATRMAYRKRGFRQHLRTYVLVNAMLVVIWAVTGADYFWPIWPILGWGIGIGFHAWGIYAGHRPPSEDEIHREMDRLRQ